MGGIHGISIHLSDKILENSKLSCFSFPNAFWFITLSVKDLILKKSVYNFIWQLWWQETSWGHCSLSFSSRFRIPLNLNFWDFHSCIQYERQQSNSSRKTEMINTEWWVISLWVPRLYADWGSGGQRIKYLDYLLQQIKNVRIAALILEICWYLQEQEKKEKLVEGKSLVN